MGNRRESIPYEEVFKALNEAKVEYLVCGGAAVVLFGFPRLTIDLDLIVSLEKDNLANIYNVLTRLNYRPQAPIKKEEFIQKEKLEELAEKKNMKVVSFYNLNDPFKVVDVGVNLPNISEILKKKEFIRIKNLKIPVISIDALMKMKKDLGRPQDLIDVLNLKEIKEYGRKKAR